MGRSTFPPLDDDFTRALLRSAEADEPSNAAYAKAAAALGVGAGLGVGASLAAPSILAAGAASAARWSSATALRLWALGVSGALLVSGGAVLLSVRAPAASRSDAVTAQGFGLQAARLPRTTPVSAAVSALVVQPTPVPAQPQPELDADELVAQATARSSSPAGLTPSKPTLKPGKDPASAATPSAEHRSRLASGSVARRPARPLSAGSVSSGSSLAEQVQSLDRARVALGSGDAGAALSEIARYRKAWPQGVFLTEASVLEIEALASRGERSLAAVRAAAFVAAHPDSPQAERLRRLIPAQKP